MTKSVAFHLKDTASGDAGQALFRDWLNIANAETAALSPWLEMQAEFARRLQQQAMQPWLSLWSVPATGGPAR